MSAKKDTIGRTILVTVLLCVACSVVVSSAAVLLKPQQVANKELDRKSNILAAAGLGGNGVSVDEAFKKITTKVVDLETGKFTDDVDPNTYDAAKASKDPAMSEALSRDVDIASIKRQARYQTVYLVENEGQLDRIILPVKGYGLWSTLYGFMALEGDLNTVVGLGFYSHAETPGLGGEVDNPNWKAQGRTYPIPFQGSVPLQR
jgi:Na+-transporting NADH:ubiquinone oxidoreductase subunit C